MVISKCFLGLIQTKHFLLNIIRRVNLKVTDPATEVLLIVRPVIPSSSYKEKENINKNINPSLCLHRVGIPEIIDLFVNSHVTPLPNSQAEI